MERRTLTITRDYQTREEDGKKYISGYFAVFGQNYELWEGASESIDPGAFDGELDGDVRALCNHDTRIVLGRTIANTLTLSVDDIGLYGDILINEQDQDALNTWARVKRGDVSQCSFGFDIVREELTETPDGKIHWTIKQVKLYEVSVCTFPAYEDTSIEARKRESATMSARKLEQLKNTLRRRLKHA